MIADSHQYCIWGGESPPKDFCVVCPRGGEKGIGITPQRGNRGLVYKKKSKVIGKEQTIRILNRKVVGQGLERKGKGGGTTEGAPCAKKAPSSLTMIVGSMGSWGKKEKGKNQSSLTLGPGTTFLRERRAARDRTHRL